MMLPVTASSSLPKEYALDTDGLNEVKLGSQVRTEEFMLQPGLVFFNIAANGSVPRRVMQLQQEYMYEREGNPDFWFRSNAKTYMDQTRSALAEFVGADVSSIHLVVNATTAINCAVRSFPFCAGDALLSSSYNYINIDKLCEDFTTRIRPDVQRVNLHLPFPPKSEEEIIKKYEDILSEHKNIKLAIIDHIASPRSIVLPVKKLINLCHNHGVTVIIDGAHCLGQLELNMEELNADVYIADAHKWLHSPRGCALLYVSEASQSWVQPPSTSPLIGRGMDEVFFAQGTMDHVPLICARHGLEFHKALGGLSRINSHTRNMADKIVAYLKELGLEPLPLPKGMETPSMRLFAFPPLRDFKYSGDREKLRDTIFGNSPVLGCVVFIEDKFYLRVCARVHTSPEDVAQLVQVMKDFLNSVDVAVNEQAIQ